MTPTYSAGKSSISILGVAVNHIDGNLKVHKGDLAIGPMRMSLEGGDTQMNLDVKSSGVPEVKLHMTANDATLGTLIAKLQGDIPIRGYTNAIIKLHAKGRSPHELASSVSGNVNIGMENMQIPYHLVEILTGDIFGWVLSHSGKSKYANLNCSLISFGAEAGELKSNVLLADGPRVSLHGKAELDLGKETLDIVLLPKRKRRLFSSVTPVKIHGPIQSPTVSAIPAKAAAQEIGMVAAFAPVVLPVRAVEKLISMVSDDDNIGGGCSNFKDISEELNVEFDEAAKQ